MGGGVISGAKKEGFLTQNRVIFRSQALYEIGLVSYGGVSMCVLKNWGAESSKKMAQEQMIYLFQKLSHLFEKRNSRIHTGAL